MGADAGLSEDLMSEFLLEIFSEEIPAAFQTLAQAQLAHTFELRLKKENINFDTLKNFGTPRRMGIVITGLPLIQPDRVEEKRGPRIDAPEAAIEGFLKAVHKQRAECEEREVGSKGPFLFATVHERGKPTIELLALLIQEILENFEWPKSMRWKTDEFVWARPLHSILALFDGQVVPVKIDQLNLKACAHTFGHRFLSPHKIDVKNYADYKVQLAENYVQIDPLERQSSIMEQIDKVLSHKQLKLEQDPSLLEEVANLVEWPIVLLGTIDARFTQLPEEVLITSMRVHQRYFATRDAAGKLAPYFLITSNMETADQGQQIIDGNERVLRARLSDAYFFWNQDMKRPLLEWATPLSRRVFQEKLGTISDKIKRMQEMSDLLAPLLTVDPQEARETMALLKADLSTGMVGEFPELQGIMGSHYAIAQGLPSTVAQAIREHYAPAGPQDQCPKAPLSIHASLIDKLDTLVNFFAIGLVPTASKDPYALRRTALGIIRLIHENELSLSIYELLTIAMTVSAHTNADDHALRKTIREFLQDRLMVYLKPLYAASLLNAVMGTEWDGFITQHDRKLSALKAFFESPEGTDFITVYKRAANILKQAPLPPTQETHAHLFGPEEKALLDAIQTTEETLNSVLKTAQPNYIQAIRALAHLKSPMESFFANVLVQDQDADRRHNRLNLLRRIEEECLKICDLSKL
jgi:glycyl-tRNA synthetase beta chain